ncbi:serine/threonine-protein kinase RsbW [Geodermatophilus bullaregiensis]|uniref:SpoIIE family protein phosphatase n=1 Tax=Geodermatophilus bullaregiensis TaxID=1564160 RepID=UPI001EF8C82B|nr:SpoIIE family protein phosphatase [Geodermatophilus bullaregiensis]MBM7805282.1 serine/threonine-protein kinase RsbW [Geodermatophilus bullaregiensis]
MDRAENGPRDEGLARLLEEDPADLYENAPCGYLSMVPDGRVVKVNGTFCAWTGRHPDDVRGRRLPDLLSAGGRVFYETHLAPLLRLQGAVREVALDVVRADGSVLPCLLNAVEVRDAEGQPVLVRATVFEATSRRRYERALLSAQRAAADSEARARTLQQVVSELAAASSAEQVADVVVRRARSAVEAGGAGLWLAEPVPGERVEGQPVPVTLAAADGLSAELLVELATAAPAGAELVRTGGVRAAPVGPELRQRWPGLAATMTEAGQEALVVVPVSAADDRHLGALVLVLGVTDDSELISLSEPGTRGALVPADAELLATLGRQAGQALERVRLYEETVRQAARSAFLLDAARLLAAPSEVGETVERLAELAVQQLADICVIDLVTERGLVAPVVAHADPARRHLVEQLRDEHLPRRDGSHPSVRAMVEHRTIWARGVDPPLMELLSTSPEHLEVTRALELADLICVPLMVEGRPLGVISLGADARRGRFTEADVETAEQLALQMSQGMDVAQRFELESRTSHTLQGSLLPPDPPEVPGLALAVRYLPGSRGADVGGDFYDVVPLPGGTDVALAVGDVVGHDVTAAATMGQLRSVHRALLVDRPRPGALVERLHDSWPLLGLPRMATALFATLRPSTGELRIASAGHLPPLLVTGGRAELLPVSPGRVLGAPPGPAPEWSGRLPAGASLVLFTDGLVESRTADLDAGLDRLRAVAEEVAAESEGPADPDVLCDRLLAVLTGPRRADDVALLVLTRLSGTAGDGTGAGDVAVPGPDPGPALPAVVPAPDPDLADALDGAGGDVTVSGDAMRWSPERAEPPAPAAGFTGLDVAAGLGMALGLDPASVRRLVSGALHRLSGVAGDVVGELRQLARDVRPGGDEDR